MEEPSMRKLIAGNWKMNCLKGEGVALARELGVRYAEQEDPAFDLLLCPPATLIDAVGRVVAGSGVLLGGQDCHDAQKGAPTGDIAAPMRADLCCSHVLVTHSERWQNPGEPDSALADKATAAP